MKITDPADPSPTSQFARRKQKILSDLAVPEDRYSDASPKGTVDAGIRSLIDAINARAGLVTTSSCAGRVSVYLEGGKGKRRTAPPVLGHQPGVGGEGEDGDGNRNEATVPASVQGTGASAGGKGGGEWLFVSHDPVSIESLEKEGGLGAVLGLELETEVGPGALTGRTEEPARLIHFKFEPMILHILTASLEHAQLVIQAGMEAGFRETGAVSLLKRQPDEEATPMVAVRCMGLAFESLIGMEVDGLRRSIVSPEYLRMLLKIANERFVENQKRISRFSAALEDAFATPKGKENWEDAQARRERKRQEGLRQKDELGKEKRQPVDEPSLDLILQQPDVL